MEFLGTATPFHLHIVNGCRLEVRAETVWLAKSKIFTNLKNYLSPAGGSARVFPGPAASTLPGTC